MTFLHLLILSVAAAASVSAVMAAAWRVQQSTSSSKWVDASWTFGVGGTAIVMALVPFHLQAGLLWRQFIVAAAVGAWSLRLGLHIVARSRSVKDDPRYRQMADEWQASAARRMFWFLQSQAAVGAVLVISTALAAHNLNPALRIQDIVAIFIVLAGIAGEAIADAQLRRFTRNPTNRKAVCDVGLWGWSRHPNYFFEWLVWLAYPLFAIDFANHNPFGWLALAAPAIMYWVLVRVSGIPPLERHMLRTRGDEFRAYQGRVRAFFPVPR